MTPCREWRSKGYGKRGQVYVHRWVMAQIHGWAALQGRVVLHLCDNPPCYRYDHLRLGTQADNLRDAHDKGRMLTPEPKRGHAHHSSKLTEEQVLLIRQRYAAGGVTHRQLADEYGVSHRNIGLIVRRQIWRCFP